MDIEKLLAELAKLEGTESLVSQIRACFTEAQTKNQTLIGEKRTVSAKNQILTTAITSIAKALKLEGEDVGTLAGQVVEAVEKSTGDLAELTETKTKSDKTIAELTEKVQNFERSESWDTFAEIASGNAKAMADLLGDRFDKIKVKGEGDEREIEIDGQPLAEYIEKDPKLSLYKAVLLTAPGGGGDDDKPKGGASGVPPKKKKAGDDDGETKKAVAGSISAYMGKNYGGAKLATKKEAS